MPIRIFSLDDVEAILPVHKLAFADTVGVAMGNRYLKTFLRWFAAYPPAICLVFVREGTICGYVFGAPKSYGVALNHALVGAMIGGVLIHPWIVFRPEFTNQIPDRLNKLFSRSKAPASSKQSEVFSLVGIGVHPDYRQQGIGTELIAAFEQCVWQAGYPEIQLSVRSGNQVALKLYQSRGWEPIQDTGVILRYRLRSRKAATGP